MTEPTFTKDCLRFCIRVGHDRPETFNIASVGNPDANIASLAAFALAQMEGREKAEAERDDAGVLCKMYSDRLSGAVERLTETEAERDRLAKELAEAEEAIRMIERITVTYEDARGDGECERVARTGQEFLDHPAVLRARERGGRG